MARASAHKKTKEREGETPQRTDDAPSRPIWKGNVSFGLVTIPISLFPMEKRSDLSFRLLDRRDHSGIRYQRVNEATGKEVPWEEIVKAYEYSEDQFIEMSDEDFERAEIESSHSIDITDFVPRADVDDSYFDKPYVAVPAKKSEKGYVLLREALAKNDCVGIAKVAIRTREHLAALLPKGDALVLVLLRFAHELRPLSAFDLPRGSLESYRVTDRELTLAEQLVQSMVAEWKPERYKDEYRDALLAYIEQKADKGHVKVRKEAPDRPASQSSNVVDLAALLRESMKGNAKTQDEKPRRRKSS